VQRGRAVALRCIDVSPLFDEIDRSAPLAGFDEIRQIAGRGSAGSDCHGSDAE
jgi:hypothetical protein